jgi:hypothetical protein
MPVEEISVRDPDTLLEAPGARKMPPEAIYVKPMGGFEMNYSIALFPSVPRRTI